MNCAHMVESAANRDQRLMSKRSEQRSDLLPKAGEIEVVFEYKHGNHLLDKKSPALLKGRKQNPESL